MVKTAKISQIIGEGKYGCVHKPSLKCKKTRKTINYKNKISKIMKKSEAEIEMKEYNIMEQIDRAHEYYLGAPLQCSPEKTEAAKKSVKRCDYFSPKNLDDYRLLVMDYGGLQLKQFADKIYHQSSENAPKKYQKIMRDFWKESRRLFEGVLLLKRKNVIHNDLKPQNIVYDIKKRRLNFIDFGLMMMTDDIKKMGKSSTYYNTGLHWSYPPEIIFINKDEFDRVAAGEKGDVQFARREKQFKDFVRDVEDDANGHINYFMEVTEKSFGGQPEKDHNLLEMIKRHMDEFHTFLFRDIDEYSYEDFINSLLNTIDTYGLGISLIYVLHRTAYLIPTDVARELNALFLDMLHFNVFKRIQPEEAGRRFEKIIQEW
jgi:serine/threonine protein kinase